MELLSAYRIHYFVTFLVFRKRQRFDKRISHFIFLCGHSLVVPIRVKHIHEVFVIRLNKRI